MHEPLFANVIRFYVPNSFSIGAVSFVNNANKYQGFKLETFIIAIFIHFPSLFMHFYTFFLISANLKMHSLLICLLFKY